MKAAKLPTPEPEYKFAKALGRKWAFDYAWPERLIALEIEGATFGRVIHVISGYEKRKGKSIPIVNKLVRLGGRHTEGTGFDKDCEKYAHAAALGWCVIRVSTWMVKNGSAIQLLEMAFKMRPNYSLPVSLSANR